MQTYLRLLYVVLCLLAAALISGESLMAQRSNTDATFSRAVQLPGVLLPAGAYHFSFPADGRVVVVSDSQHRVLGTFVVNPISRPKGGDIITLRPSVGDAAPEVAALYPTGGTTGVAFNYRGLQK